MRIRGMHHTGLTVASVGRSLAFYHDVLGMAIIAEQLGTAGYLSQVTGFPGVRLRLAFLQAPGSDHILELIEYVSHPGEPVPRETNRPGNGHLCFLVDDIDQAYDHLAQKGVRFLSPEPVLVTDGVNRGARVAYFRDPDGFTLELFQPPGSRAAS